MLSPGNIHYTLQSIPELRYGERLMESADKLRRSQYCRAYLEALQLSCIHSTAGIRIFVWTFRGAGNYRDAMEVAK